jgi:dTDP-glucose pyrophosphorylase
LNTDNPLLIANSDQFLQWNSSEVLHGFQSEGIDGGIVTFTNTHPKWSFVRIDDNGFVSEVAEKKVISNMATVGIYYWKHGSDFVKYAKEMIENNIRTNNEFYIAPVFNEAIKDGKKIRATSVASMWGLGTPEDLKYFLEHHR